MTLGRYAAPVRDRGGALTPGVPVAVYNAGTTDLASVYRNAAGTSPADNPVSARLGTAQLDFYAAPGLYDLAVAGVLIAESVVVPLAPADITAAAEVLGVFFVSGALSAAAFAQKVPAPFAATITGVRLAVGTAPVGAAILVDVNKAGTTIFTTQGNRPTIADGATSGGPGTAPDVTTLATGNLLSVDVDQIGSGTAGSDLTVVVLGTRT